MQALLETTVWAYPNHIYLLDGDSLVAYIRAGTTEPYYFKKPIKGFDRRGRKFKAVEPNPFDAPAVALHLTEVRGSKGAVYHVDKQAQTCTCPGFTFRGACKHLKELA
jgi:hypothetical protein